MRLARLSLCLLLISPLALGTIIHVPKDQPTIQAGINAANNGDTVLVAPGTYLENINFNGKAITVISAKGPKVTIIDGGKAASVVTFATGETLTSVLHGFTLQNGVAGLEGGGIAISSSPTVTGNIIQNNGGCNGGGGVGIAFASPLVQGNTIVNNSQVNCGGGIGGGGISVRGAGSPQIVGNLISNNAWAGNGGGITLFAAGTPTIMNNILMGNISPNGQGGGIYIVNDSNALIVQNLFINNSALQGGGIFMLVPSGSVGPILVNNTIIGGANVSQGSSVYTGGFDNQVQFFNNLLIGLYGETAVYCDGTYDQQPPVFNNNDAFSQNGNGLQGTCAGQSNQNGNISAAPHFVDRAQNNYQLTRSSPAINAGTNSAPDLPGKDLAGHKRIVGGTVDMGAYEYQRKAPWPVEP